MVSPEKTILELKEKLKRKDAKIQHLTRQKQKEITRRDKKIQRQDKELKLKEKKIKLLQNALDKEERLWNVEVMHN